MCTPCKCAPPSPALHLCPRGWQSWRKVCRSSPWCGQPCMWCSPTYHQSPRPCSSGPSVMAALPRPDVCVFLCVYGFLDVCSCVCVFLCVYVFLYVCPFVCVYSCVCVPGCVFPCVCVPGCVFLCVCVFLYVCSSVCFCVCAFSLVLEITGKSHSR